MSAFQCGSWNCPECGLARAQAVRAGVYRAVRARALPDMLTLTLGPGARGTSPVEARTALLVLFNAFRTRLRKRGFLGSYLWVVEAHEDPADPEDYGFPHLHVACNLRLLLAAAGNQEWAQGYVAQAWNDLGGGFVSASFGRDDCRGAAAYLSKYIGKAAGKAAPWESVRYCTEDTSFRVRPWHRYGGSRDVLAAMKRPDELTVGTWMIVRANDTGSPWEPWNPAKGSAMVPACAEAGGHPPTPDWVPGDCHHGGGAIGNLGQCFCVPPWAYEPVWSEPLMVLADVADLTALSRDRRRELVDARRPRTISQEAVDWALRAEAGIPEDRAPWEAGPWWNGTGAPLTDGTPIVNNADQGG